MFRSKRLSSINTVSIAIIVLAISVVSIFAETVAVQIDGKIIVAGTASNGFDNDFSVRRFNNNGTVDLTFGSKGRVLTNIRGYHDSANAVIIESDSKIVVAGSASNGMRNDFAVVRYNPNGSLDPTFGNNGIVITNFASYSSQINAIAYRSVDRKIVVSGYVHYGWNQHADTDFATIRYNHDGSADSTFGFFGRKVTSFSAYSIANSVAIDNLGRVYVGGVFIGTDHEGMALVRYNYNGSTDTAFGSAGQITYIDKFQAMALDSRSNVVVATRYQIGPGTGTANYIKLQRFNSAGLLDSDFGGGGVRITGIVGWEIPNAITIQPDQKITVLGQSGSNMVLVRYNHDGSNDLTFGSGGIVYETISRGFGSVVYYPSGGKTLAFVEVSGGRKSLIRYAFDVSRDSGFGSGGVVSVDF